MKNDNLDLAVALRYDGEGAPRVSATGKGSVAQKIIEIAKENDVPLYEEPELVQLLSAVELNEEIPETLYIAVAEVIAFAYQLSGKSL